MSRQSSRRLCSVLPFRLGDGGDAAERRTLINIADIRTEPSHLGWELNPCYKLQTHPE